MRWYWRLAISMTVVNWIPCTLVVLCLAPAYPSTSATLWVGVIFSPLILPLALLNWWVSDLSFSLEKVIFTACYVAIIAGCYKLTCHLFPDYPKLKPGCCHVCGYDLRATPDRCPECGTVVEKVIR